MKLWLIGFIMTLGASSMAGSIRYLHLQGHASLAGQNQIVADIKSKLSGPVDQAGTHVMKSYQWGAENGGGFYFNLIIEPMDQSGADFLNHFMASLESAGFYAMPVKFKVVKKITERVDLMAGKHRAASTDNSFDMDSEIPKNFDLTSVNAWFKFTDKTGFALDDPDHSKFLTYLADFFQDANAYNNYIGKVLNHDDVILADLTPMIILEDGTQVGTADDVSPFFDMPFARNCWMSGFENGTCATQN